MHIRWRGLELPGSVVPDQKTLTGTYGKFVAEPFERGFGTTVGNSLRRVLLSSLEGSAVTQIKMAGALHEFTTIKGVLEDVTDIVLAVKSLVVKNHSDSTRVIRVERSTKGPITGGDVITDDAVEVVNKDLVLATLTDDVPFELEMVVENGRGYVPSSEHSQVSQEIGIIPVDAVFSPVTRVKYEVEETRVGQKTNYDRLTLEIWTNGTVTPEMALVEAAKILRKHLNPFVGYTKPGPAAAWLLPGACWRSRLRWRAVSECSFPICVFRCDPAIVWMRRVLPRFASWCPAPVKTFSSCGTLATPRWKRSRAN